MTKTRRAFLELTAACAAGCAAAGLLGGCSANSGAPLLANDVVLTLTDYSALSANGGQVEIASRVSGYPFPIFVRNDGGVYTALGGYCNHQACPVSAVSSGFRCGCHGATFSQDGRVTAGPATQAMPTFNTQVSGDTLTILKG